MKYIQRYHYEIYLFIIEAVCMILELCASRTLSPYFGDSNLIWTSIIGIILLSASIGNTIGGKLADRADVEKVLWRITLLAALLILYVPVFSTFILALTVSVIDSLKIGAIIGTILLFLPSSLTFGTIPPIITKLKLKDLDEVGKTAGTIHSVSTLGGIFGTFLGGFFLVPHFGCTNILLTIAAATAATNLLVGGKKNLKYIGLILVVVLACIFGFTRNNFNSANAILSGNENYIASYDTQYSRVEIVNRVEDGEMVRYMVVGNGCESATYVDEAKKYELVVPYTKYYDLMFRAGIGIHNVLMIGGGGYSYPKFCVSHHAETSMDVVEIDSKITELAQKYFFLNDALADFNTTEGTRLNLICDDGKVYINTSEKKYDAVLNDAFTGTTPVRSLATIETVRQIHDMLNPGGVYLSNIIGSHVGEGSQFLKAEANTIAQVFRYVYIIPCVESREAWSAEIVTNNMLVASDVPLELPGTAFLDYSAGLILTDDYCPVDTLIPGEN